MGQSLRGSEGELNRNGVVVWRDVHRNSYYSTMQEESPKVSTSNRYTDWYFNRNNRREIQTKYKTIILIPHALRPNYITYWIYFFKLFYITPVLHTYCMLSTFGIATPAYSFKKNRKVSKIQPRFNINATTKYIVWFNRIFN